MSFEKVAEAPWFALIYPFQFGFPKFEIVSIITMCIVMIVVMIESAGMFLALGDMTGKHDRSRRHVARACAPTGSAP